MKNLQLKYKLPLLILINTIPFALDVIFYRAGAPLELPLFLIAVIILSSLNNQCCNKALHYVIVQLYLLACLISAGYISTHLYYTNISADPMTPAIGMGIVFFWTVIVIIITVVTGTLKRTTEK